MSITFSAKRLAYTFTGIATAFVLIHVVLQIVRFATGNHSLMGLLALFSLGADNNLPEYYSALAILCCGGMLAMIGLAGHGESRIRGSYWLGLSLVFACLSVDELVQLHERVDRTLKPVFADVAVLFYAWVVPYAAALVVFVAIYVRFLMLLPRRTARLFVGAGTLYVGGALGLEMVGGWLAATQGTLTVAYVVAQSVEEILEMAGIVVFLYAVARYAEQRFGAIELRLSADPSPSPAQRRWPEPEVGPAQPTRGLAGATRLAQR